jgi:hypothetical protein
MSLHSCDEPHVAEVIGILEHPDAGGGYPGEDELLDYGYAHCEPIFTNYVGVDEYSTELVSARIAPFRHEWHNGIYRIACFATRLDGKPLTMSVAGQADHPKVALDVGDLLPIHRLTFDQCFDLPFGSAEAPFERYDGLTQLVAVADCTGPYAGELAGFYTFGGEAAAYDLDAVTTEAELGCEDELTAWIGLTRAELAELGGELVTIVPERVEWEAGANYAICLLIAASGDSRPQRA